MLNGSFVYASSRTQRVVSLSSCEAELHSMVSCLYDGIYLKRCIQFVMNCQVEHYLLVDSSSARQIALRLGPGKLKHVAGRILWIQQAVAEGSVQLAQVGTMWNLSDLGTKPLGGNRLRFLLHEISMSSESGTVAIGEEEYQLQVRKHGSVKHVGLLAKQVARVILMMGLGPTDGILGAAGSFVPGDASEGLQQCAFEPNDPSLQSTSFSWSFICVCLFLLTGLIYLFFKLYRMIHKVHPQFNTLQTDISVLEPLVDKLCRELNEGQAEVRRLRVAYDELNGQQEMLCDSIESVQWGVIHLGGYTYFDTLTPEQRARMYSVERGNLIAARTMGMQQYLNNSTSQSRS